MDISKIKKNRMKSYPDPHSFFAKLEDAFIFHNPVTDKQKQRVREAKRADPALLIWIGMINDSIVIYRKSPGRGKDKIYTYQGDLLLMYDRLKCRDHQAISIDPVMDSVVTDLSRQFKVRKNMIVTTLRPHLLCKAIRDKVGKQSVGEESSLIPCASHSSLVPSSHVSESTLIPVPSSSDTSESALIPKKEFEQYIQNNRMNDPDMVSFADPEPSEDKQDSTFSDNKDSEEQEDDLEEQENLEEQESEDDSEEQEDDSEEQEDDSEEQESEDDSEEQEDLEEQEEDSVEQEDSEEQEEDSVEQEKLEEQEDSEKKEEVIETPAEKASETPVEKAPEAPAEKAPEAPAEKAPEAPAEKAPEAPAEKETLIEQGTKGETFIEDDPLYSIEEGQGQPVSIRYCHSTRKSKREYQEDRASHFSISLSPKDIIHAWAVYDGHGGEEVSDHLYTENFLEKYVEALFVKESGLPNRSDIEAFFTEWDTKYYHESRAGSTAVIVVIRGEKIITAHIGDSSAVLFDSKGDVIFETRDHKPQDEDELARIKAAGGYMYAKRVNGNLATSRAFGDSELKMVNNAYTPDGPVSARPSVSMIDLPSQSGKYYIAIASDGIWDCCKTKTEAAAILIKQIGNKPICSVCDAIVNKIERHGYHGTRGDPNEDNKTIIMVEIQKQ
jgi:serine/threonine protein phosphatase PrpC